MNKLCFFISLIFLPSCGSYFIKNEKKDMSFHYLGESKIKGNTSQDIKKTITKKVKMGGGNYKIDLFPISKPYLLAQLDEFSLQRGLKSNEKDLVFNKWKELWLKDKTCFQMDYSILRFKKAVPLKDWKIYFLDKDDTPLPMRWSSEKQDTKAILSFERQGLNNLEKWTNKGIACLSKKMNLQDHFAIKIIAPYVQFPFDTSKTVYWEFDKFSMVNGVEVPIIKEKRTKKGYRGW